MPRHISYWILPLVGSVVWIAMTIAMLVVWTTSGKPHYSTMCDKCTIAYISDVGAGKLKPLFIAGSAITGVCFFLTISAERFLRHRGRLVANTGTCEKVLVVISLLGAALGTVSLLLLSIFDVKRHKSLHDLFLLLFVVGTIVAAVFIIVEYWRLEKNNKKVNVIVRSFYAKCVFVVVLVPGAIVFGVFMMKGNQNVAAVLEWAIAFLFTGFIIIFIWDLYPAVKTDNGEWLEEKHAASRNYRGSDSTYESRVGRQY